MSAADINGRTRRVSGFTERKHGEAGLNRRNVALVVTAASNIGREDA